MSLSFVPLVQVQAQFTPGTWTDISPYVQNFTVTRPATRLLGPLWQYQAGTLAATLDNSDGRFDPDNLAGPYISSSGLQQVIWTCPAGQQKTWVAPRNLSGTTIMAECLAAGDAGATGPGTGGGSGEYSAEDSYTVIPGNSYVAIAHSPGLGNTTFDGTGVVAHAASGQTGGTGSTNSVHFSGANGGNAGSVNGGGGASSASPSSAGNPGTAGNSGGAGAPAVPGGYGGGNGATGVTNSGQPGLGPGAGGGGGGFQQAGPHQFATPGGAGKGGWVRLTYFVTITPSATVSQILPMVPVQVSATWPPPPAGSSPAARVGAYIGQTSFEQTDFSACNTLWTGWSTQAITVTRYYANTNYTYTTNLQEMVAAGVRIAISFNPGYNPVSSTDLASIVSLLATLKAAGADVVCTIWHEPFFSGLTAAQYTAAVQYYSPSMRAYYPFYCVYGGSTDSNSANGYYPGDAYCDGVGIDIYLTSGFDYTSNPLLSAAAIANGATPAKPLAIWEFGTTTGPNFFTGDNHTFAVGLGNWVSGHNAPSVVHSTAVNPFGVTGALLMTATAGGTTSSVQSAAAASFATQMQACSAGDEIFLGAWTQAGTTGRACTVGASFYTSGGTFISTVLSADASATATDGSSGWTSITGKVTAPATAAFWAEVVSVALPALSETHRVAMTYGADSTSTGHTQGGSTTFWQWIQSYMTGRVTAGYTNGDILLFNDGMPGNANVTAIQHSSDYRIPLFLALYAAANGISVPNRHALFTGFADAWQESPVTYEGGYSEFVLSATDGFGVLSNNTLAAVGSLGASDDSGARVNRILDIAGWSPAARVIDTGNSLLQATTLGDTALNLMQLAADTEIGELYVNGAGSVVFRRREGILSDTRSTTVQGVFGDSPGTTHTAGTELALATVGRADDNTTIANDIQITAAGSSNLQEAQDPVSQYVYQSARSYVRSDLLLSSDTEALEYANFVLYVSKNAENRFDTITIDPLADTANLYPQVLGREIGDRIEIWKRPPNVATPVSKDVFIRGITHTYDATSTGQNAWSTTWTLQQASKYSNFLTLDSSTLGLLDVDALAY